jgi:hypothetical protein
MFWEFPGIFALQAGCAAGASISTAGAHWGYKKTVKIQAP